MVETQADDVHRGAGEGDGVEPALLQGLQGAAGQPLRTAAFVGRHLHDAGARLAEGRQDLGARDLLRANAGQVHAVAAPPLAEDIDTPEQARAVTGDSLGANPAQE